MAVILVGGLAVVGACLLLSYWLVRSLPRDDKVIEWPAERLPDELLRVVRHLESGGFGPARGLRLDGSFGSIFTATLTDPTCHFDVVLKSAAAAITPVSSASATSWFQGGTFVTSNIVGLPLLGTEVVQVTFGSEVNKLIAVHDEALDGLRTYGADPILLDPLQSGQRNLDAYEAELGFVRASFRMQLRASLLIILTWCRVRQHSAPIRRARVVSRVAHRLSGSASPDS